jgi:hypothetical protein
MSINQEDTSYKYTFTQHEYPNILLKRRNIPNNLMVYLKELDKGENQTQISKRNAKGIEQK